MAAMIGYLPVNIPPKPLLATFIYIISGKAYEQRVCLTKHCMYEGVEHLPRVSKSVVDLLVARATHP